MKKIIKYVNLTILICGFSSSLIYAQENKFVKQVKLYKKRIQTQEHINIENELISFDNPFKSKGIIELDMSDIDLKKYDRLEYDLFLEGGMTNINTTLWGYPDNKSIRNYYIFKRTPKINKWDSISLDLNLDDDQFNPNKNDKPPLEKLIFRFSKDKNDATPESLKVKIKNIRFVKLPVSINVDLNNTTVDIDKNSMKIVYSIVIQNKTLRPLSTILEIDKSLSKFKINDYSRRILLQANETKKETIEIVILHSQMNKLPIGYTEKCALSIRIPELNNLKIEPIRGYRPLYLFGVIPLNSKKITFNTSKKMSKNDLQKLLKSTLNWKLEAPFDVKPTHNSRFLCKKCQRILLAKNINTYYCRNSKCSEYNKKFTVDKKNPLFATYLATYHNNNAILANNLMAAFQQTGNKLFAEKAKTILLVYAENYVNYKVIKKNSLGYLSRLTCAILFEKAPLINFSEAFIKLNQSNQLTPQEKNKIKQKLLLPLLLSVNNFFYGASAGQLGITLAVLKGAAATGNPFFLADALGGDGGVSAMLTRSFTHDGIPIEGGVYAKVALQRIKILAKLLKMLNIDADNQRIQQILYNSNLLFNFKAPKNSETLKCSGWTFLINKKEPRLKLSVNWGTSRERLESDLTSYILSDQYGILVGEAGRMPYGHPLSFSMYKTFAHNVPVINEQNITKEKLKQTYFYSDRDYSCSQLLDTAKNPAYPGVRLCRSFILLKNHLLVVDKIVSKSKVKIDIPYYIKNAIKESVSWKDTEKILKLGCEKQYKIPYDLSKTKEKLGTFKINWRCGKRKKRNLLYQYLGSPAFVVSGKTKAGWRVSKSDFLMLRIDSNQAIMASLYSVSYPQNDLPLVNDFEKIPVLNEQQQSVTDQDALSYRITLNNSKKINILITFKKERVHTSSIKSVREKRILVKILD